MSAVTSTFAGLAECPDNQREIALPLLEHDFPHKAWVASYMQGHTFGRLFVDRIVSPARCAIVLCRRRSFVFAFGSVRKKCLQEALADRRFGEAFHFVQGTWGSAVKSLPFGYKRTTSRLEFSTAPTAPIRYNERHPLPKGFVLRRIDQDLLSKYWHRSGLVAAYGIRELFLRLGIGFCIVQNGRIVAEAVGVFPTTDTCEVGVETRKQFRGRGLGYVACAALVNECIESGRIPKWSCGSDNGPSVALAKSLGFGQGREYCMAYYETKPHPRHRSA